jgi:hypothetical protein
MVGRHPKRMPHGNVILRQPCFVHRAATADRVGGWRNGKLIVAVALCQLAKKVAQRLSSPASFAACGVENSPSLILTPSGLDLRLISYDQRVTPPRNSRFRMTK